MCISFITGTAKWILRPQENTDKCRVDTVDKTIHFSIYGERKNNLLERKNIREFLKTDLYMLIEILLAIEITGKDHSKCGCRNCAGRLVILDFRISGAYESFRITH